MHTRQSVAVVPQYQPNLSETIIETTRTALAKMRVEGLPDSPDNLAVLPFVDLSVSDSPRFWKVKTTGNYDTDCELGTAYAALYLQYLRLGGESSLFWIERGMELNADESTHGIGVGFMEELGSHLTHIAKMVDVERAYERGARQSQAIAMAVHGGARIYGSDSVGLSVEDWLATHATV